MQKGRIGTKDARCAKRLRILIANRASIFIFTKEGEDRVLTYLSNIYISFKDFSKLAGMAIWQLI